MKLVDLYTVKQMILAERDKIRLTVPAASYELVKEKPNMHGNAMRGGIRIALRCLETAPAVDAVEVVRCKDCKHWMYEYDDVGLCVADVPDIDGVERTAFNFCSIGERKET